MPRYTTRIGALALVVGLSACGSSGSSKPAAPTSTTSTRGQTITLVAHESFATSKGLLDRFTSETGIKVKVLAQGDAGEVVNRAILTIDRPQGDVLYGVDNTLLSRALARGLFAPQQYSALDALTPAVRAQWRSVERDVVPVDYGDVCVNYDTGWFAKHAKTPPKTLADLVAPAYKGLTVVESPATSSTGLAFLAATVARYGESGYADYWTKLKANGVLAVAGWSEAYETEFTVSGGSRPIVVSYASSPPADVVYANPAKSTPAIAAMTDGCFRQFEFAGVLHGAAHPAAAKQFVEWMLSKTFQDDMPLNMFVYPTISAATLPDVFAKWAAVPADPLTLPAPTITKQRDGWIATWKRIVLS